MQDNSKQLHDDSLQLDKKVKMLSEAKKNLVEYVAKITQEIKHKEVLIDKIYKDIERGVYGRDHAKEAALITVANARERLEEAKFLQNSPYFTKCNTKFDDENLYKDIYFGMYTFPSLNIYSWVAPVATIRFDKPGKVSYDRPSGGKRTGNMQLKDNFLVENQEIKYYSSESEYYENTLIYQESFTRESLSEFGLKNIVRQMEKYQDQIIRIPHKGSLLISGPAGSGKTTLVFHRIAYLCQSPLTKPYFPQYDIAVFVQDEATVEYFKNLLPKLGIKKVRVFTFATWALLTLGLKDYKTVEFEDGEEFMDDAYQYEKFKLLKSFSSQQDSELYNCTDIKNLTKFYTNNLKPKHTSIFKEQLKIKQLDRFDLTILLKAFFIKEATKGRMKNHKYSLIAIDEVENYLTDQVKILKSCVRESTNSIVYIGDLRQKTFLFTLSNWNEINEDFENNSERKIEIPKSYRNTKQILEYLRKLNFDVNFPEDIKHGPEVREYVGINTKDRLKQIKEIIQSNSNKLIGIIGANKKSILAYSEEFKEFSNVKVLTIHEAQGVEFQLVITIDLDQLFTKGNDVTNKSVLVTERKKINRDLLYVALTRAIEELVNFYCEGLEVSNIHTLSKS